MTKHNHMIPWLAAASLAALKIAGVIAWPWWLVAAPLWFAPALFVAGLAGTILSLAMLGLAAVLIGIHADGSIGTGRFKSE